MMLERLEGRARILAERRAAAARDAIAAAEFPLGIVAEREGEAVVLRGRQLMRRLAFDARLRGFGLAARQP